MFTDTVENVEESVVFLRSPPRATASRQNVPEFLPNNEDIVDDNIAEDPLRQSQETEVPPRQEDDETNIDLRNSQNCGNC